MRWAPKRLGLEEMEVEANRRVILAAPASTRKGM
jgi:hypothetical protein